MAPKKRSQKQPGSGSRPRAYKLRPLDTSNYQTLFQWAASAEKNADAIDSQLAPGEFFVAKYMEGQTSYPFKSIRLLANKLMQYEASRRYGKDKGENGRDLLSSVQVMTFEGKPSEYRKGVKEMRQERTTKDEAMYENLRSQVGKYDEETKRRRTRGELVEEVLKRSEKTKADLQAMLDNNSRELAELRKMVAELSKPSKLSKKKPAKKAAKKAAKKVAIKTSRKAAKTTAKKVAVKRAKKIASTVAKRSAKYAKKIVSKLSLPGRSSSSVKPKAKKVASKKAADKKAVRKPAKKIAVTKKSAIKKAAPRDTKPFKKQPKKTGGTKKGPSKSTTNQRSNGKGVSKSPSPKRVTAKRVVKKAAKKKGKKK